MEKRNTLELLLAGALLGGAFYFLFYTERGRQLREKLTSTFTDKLDEWLEAVEQELAEAEKAAVKIRLSDPPHKIAEWLKQIAA